AMLVLDRAKEALGADSLWIQLAARILQLRMNPAVFGLDILADLDEKIRQAAQGAVRQAMDQETPTAVETFRKEVDLEKAVPDAAQRESLLAYLLFVDQLIETAQRSRMQQLLPLIPLLNATLFTQMTWVSESTVYRTVMVALPERSEDKTKMLPLLAIALYKEGDIEGAYQISEEAVRPIRKEGEGVSLTPQKFRLLRLAGAIARAREEAHLVQQGLTLAVERTTLIPLPMDVSREINAIEQELRNETGDWKEIESTTVPMSAPVTADRADLLLSNSAAQVQLGFYQVMEQAAAGNREEALAIAGRLFDKMPENPAVLQIYHLVLLAAGIGAVGEYEPLFTLSLEQKESLARVTTAEEWEQTREEPVWSQFLGTGEGPVIEAAIRRHLQRNETARRYAVEWNLPELGRWTVSVNTAVEQTMLASVNGNEEEFGRRSALHAEKRIVMDKYNLARREIADLEQQLRPEYEHRDRLAQEERNLLIVEAELQTTPPAHLLDRAAALRQKAAERREWVESLEQELISAVEQARALREWLNEIQKELSAFGSGEPLPLPVAQALFRMVREQSPLDVTHARNQLAISYNHQQKQVVADPISRQDQKIDNFLAVAL
ncbi:MAG: hypothetical protein HYS56_01445, partial [Candidatus Omnitrophica bacterium]|nr:hypothetical protein [Candidatus Omnitrophota bacterium]